MYLFRYEETVRGLCVKMSCEKEHYYPDCSFALGALSHAYSQALEHPRSKISTFRCWEKLVPMQFLDQEFWEEEITYK